MSQAERKYWFLRGSGVEPPDRGKRQNFQPGNLLKLRWIKPDAMFPLPNEGFVPETCSFNPMHGDFVFIDRVFPSRLCHWSHWSRRDLIQPSHRRFPGAHFVALATSNGLMFALDAGAKTLHAISTQGPELLEPVQAPVPILGVDIDDSSRFLVSRSGKRHSIWFWSTGGGGFYWGEGRQEIRLTQNRGPTDQSLGTPLAALILGDTLYYTTSSGLLCSWDTRTGGVPQALLGPKVDFGPHLPSLKVTAPTSLCAHEISRNEHFLNRLKEEFPVGQVTHISQHRFLVVVDAATEVVFTVGLDGTRAAPLVGPLLGRNVSQHPGNLIKEHLPGIEQVLCCGKADFLLGSRTGEWFHLDSEVGIPLDPLSAMSLSYS